MEDYRASPEKLGTLGKPSSGAQEFFDTQLIVHLYVQKNVSLNTWKNSFLHKKSLEFISKEKRYANIT